MRDNCVDQVSFLIFCGLVLLLSLVVLVWGGDVDQRLEDLERKQRPTLCTECYRALGVEHGR